MSIGEALSSRETILEGSGAQGGIVVDSVSEEDSDGNSITSIKDDPPEPYQTRFGRVVRPNVRY